MEYAKTSVEEVHNVILEDAARIANKMLSERSDLTDFQVGGGGSTFFAGSNRSSKGGLALAFDEGLAQGDPTKIIQLRAIGKEAVKRALAQNAQLFVGLIIGQARQGNNYFDRYQQEEQVKTI